MNKTFVLHSDQAEDAATSSSFRQFKIEHFHLDINVDFEKKCISGSECLRMRCIKGLQTELRFDVHPTLVLRDVSFRQDGQEWTRLDFLTQDFTHFGSTLVVKFPAPWNLEDTFELIIQYAAYDGPGVRAPIMHLVII